MLQSQLKETIQHAIKHNLNEVVKILITEYLTESSDFQFGQAYYTSIEKACPDKIVNASSCKEFDANYDILLFLIDSGKIQTDEYGMIFQEFCYHSEYFNYFRKHIDLLLQSGTNLMKDSEIVEIIFEHGNVDALKLIIENADLFHFTHQLIIDTYPEITLHAMTLNQADRMEEFLEILLEYVQFDNDIINMILQSTIPQATFQITSILEQILRNHQIRTELTGDIAEKIIKETNLDVLESMLKYSDVKDLVIIPDATDDATIEVLNRYGVKYELMPSLEPAYHSD